MAKVKTRRQPRSLKESHRSILAAERGWVRKDPGGRLSVGLIYPNTYEVGMANLGMAVIYAMINRRADMLCERAFMPGKETQKLYARGGRRLLTLESSRPLAEMGLVLATVSFENDYPRLAAMLELAGLEVWARQREGPLVIAGGVGPMLNPEPLAEVVDGFLLGEAEAVLPAFLERYHQTLGKEREDALLTLAREVPGLYAPRFYAPRYSPDGALLSLEPQRPGLPRTIPAPKWGGPPQSWARSVFQAPGPEFGEMALWEVGRGCAHACRFCAAGHIFRPPRLGCGEDFAPQARPVAQKRGRLGLVSAAVSDLPGLEKLALELTAAGGEVSVSSLRAGNLTPGIARALAAAGLKTVALAPEAGSARLRRVINKQTAEEELFCAVEALIRGGILNLKLYFMVGLPTETGEDIEELVELVRRLRQQVVSHARDRGRLGNINVSLNAFVPKPFTPFQWEAMARLGTIKARLARVKKALAGTPNLKVTSDVPKYALLQGALARGDRRMGRVIAAMAGGANPAQAFREAGLDQDFFTTRLRGKDEFFPWEIVDHGIERQYLWTEAQKARKAKESPACDPRLCTRCGVCPGPEDDV